MRFDLGTLDSVERSLPFGQLGCQIVLSKKIIEKIQLFMDEMLYFSRSMLAGYWKRVTKGSAQ